VRRRTPALVIGLVAILAAIGGAPGAPVRVARAAEYTLDSAARYDVRPVDARIDVTVELAFTNTTPDPPGFFSVFDEIELAVHDAATAVTARDDAGELDVTVAVRDGVHVATIALRDELRYEESVDVTLAYQLPDGDDPQLRVRASLVVFPAWGFGTASDVTVVLPPGYEVRVDGDPLEEEPSPDQTVLRSEPITDPTHWLSLITATRPPTYDTASATVPLDGGTADLQVRAFADDPEWGARTLELLERALPLLEERVGVPYPHVGPLIVTESFGVEAPTFDEEADGTEIAVAYDQPPFTALHQVAHVWLSPSLAEARWIREGVASWLAAAVGAELDMARPFDPAADAEAAAESAVPLDTWATGADRDVERYGYAASWAFIDQLVALVGEEDLRRVLQRAAAGVGAYEPVGETAPQPVDAVPAPLTSRAFLDQLEAVSGMSLVEPFSAEVLGPDDVARLEQRAAAREAYASLEADAGAWGVPEPVTGAMVAWEFAAAEQAIDDAAAWLEDRDALLTSMDAAGLSAPDRLHEAYRTQGGGPDARAELDAHRAVVDAYAATLAQVNAERSLTSRLGLLGGPDPAQRLQLANGHFAEGDLRGATAATSEAQHILDGAETSGLIRLLSAGVVVLLVAGLVAFLLRRRRRVAEPAG